MSIFVTMLSLFYCILIVIGVVTAMILTGSLIFILLYAPYYIYHKRKYGWA